MEWQVAGFGPLNGAGTSDMVLRDTQTGAFEVYDIARNQLTAVAALGQVGLAYQIGGSAADQPASSMSGTANSPEFSSGGMSATVSPFHATSDSEANYTLLAA